MSEPTPVVIADEFLRGLRIATLGVSTADLCLWFLPTSLASKDAYTSPALEFGSLAVLVAVLALAAVMILRDRPWGGRTWAQGAQNKPPTHPGRPTWEQEARMRTPHG